jgi:4-alpha-glucanotransferase
MRRGVRAVTRDRGRIPRMAGILIPLFSVRAREDLGCGEIPDLAAMIDFAVGMGHRAIQLLPLDEAALGQASPYSALSVFAIDPIYIATHRNGRASLAAAEIGESSSLVRVPDRARLRALKTRLLERAFVNFRERASRRERTAFEEFAESNREWLADYALFRALKTRLNWTTWESWPDPLKRREPGALDAARRELGELVTMYGYWQFLADRQWAAVREHARARHALIGGDLAFSPGCDSAEVWAHQDLFDLARSVGAPPDAFSASGQRWGLPMPSWERVRSRDFGFWRLRARRASALYDILRIDHVVGLYRTFSFAPSPDEPGVFSPATRDEQIAQGEAVIRAIREEARQAILIAEDLGTVPPFVRRSLRSIEVPGYKVMRWEKENWGRPDERFLNPAEYAELSVATSGTHDTGTLTVWWQEATEDEQSQFIRALGLEGRIDASGPLDEATLDAILEALYGSPSALVITPIQDLFGWNERINVPGSVSADNWTFRLPFMLKDRHADPAIRARMKKVRALAVRTRRFRG